MKLFFVWFGLVQIGKNSLENTLLKYGAKDYFFKASLCKFCISADEAQASVQERMIVVGELLL